LNGPREKIPDAALEAGKDSKKEDDWVRQIDNKIARPVYKVTKANAEAIH
jgi:hypothetical protein